MGRGVEVVMSLLTAIKKAVIRRLLFPGGGGGGGEGCQGPPRSTKCVCELPVTILYILSNKLLTNFLCLPDLPDLPEQD